MLMFCFLFEVHERYVSIAVLDFGQQHIDSEIVDGFSSRCG